MTVENEKPKAAAAVAPRKKYVRAVGPRLKILLAVGLGVASLLGANSLYLLGIRVLGAVKGVPYQNFFYQYMFLMHLLLGLLLVLPVIIFGIAHIKNSYNRPNKRAVRVGYMLFAAALVLLFTGI